MKCPFGCTFCFLFLKIENNGNFLYKIQELQAPMEYMIPPN